MWTRSITAWSEYFRVYAVDIIGEAGFSAPSRPRLDSDSHARWLDDLWRGLSLGQADIVGASLGGLIALDYAIRRPTHVHRLALLAPGGVVAPRTLSLLSLIPVFLMGAWGRRRTLHRLMNFDPKELSAANEPSMRLFELIFEHLAFRPMPLLVFPDQDLRTVRMPVFVVVGGKDLVFSGRRMRRRLRTCLPQADVVYLPQAGHGLTNQTAAICDFLLKAERPSRVVGHLR
jgi:pimeloyl-ACP methyl ester carboxylesterase